jgi:hypothetical protein
MRYSNDDAMMSMTPGWLFDSGQNMLVLIVIVILSREYPVATFFLNITQNT